MSLASRASDKLGGQVPEKCSWSNQLLFSPGVVVVLIVVVFVYYTDLCYKTSLSHDKHQK